MSINYNLTAAQILRILGYNKRAGDEVVNKFEKENNIEMPPLLDDFLRLAYECPLLSTSDIKTSGEFGFLYEEIEEVIEERREEWDEDPGWREEDDYYNYSIIPKEQWPDYVKDYFMLGSDYGAGVVTYGICKEDMDKEDPPVFMLFEGNEPAGWEPLSDTLSSFLMMQMCYVLLGTEYDTAKKVLKEEGWNYIWYEEDEVIKQIDVMGIDTRQAVKQIAWDDRELVCGYDEDKEILFVVSNSGNGCEMCIITK